jgi:hypothetical protein
MPAALSAIRNTLIPEDVRSMTTKGCDYLDYRALHWDLGNDTFLHGGWTCTMQTQRAERRGIEQDDRRDKSARRSKGTGGSERSSWNRLTSRVFIPSWRYGGLSSGVRNAAGRP